MRLKCSKCNIIKEFNNTNFSRTRTTLRHMCKTCQKQYNKKRYKYDPIKLHNRLQDLRRDIFNKYGGCCCTWCGESDFDALSIDHINNNGNKHREQINKFGVAFYRWLRYNDYPNGFQVLCMNCQISKVRNKGVLSEYRHKLHMKT